jgi:hypothetical protein
MKKWTGATLLLLSAIGCGGGGDPSAQERLQGNWAFTPPDGTSAIALTFTGADYGAFAMDLTSANTANAEVENGGFNASGTQIRFYPREWSCTGPDPTYAFPYKFVGTSLSITSGNTVIVFEPIMAAPATNFSVTTGCKQTGTFVPAPLAPVGN